MRFLFSALLFALSMTVWADAYPKHIESDSYFTTDTSMLPATIPSRLLQRINIDGLDMNEINPCNSELMAISLRSFDNVDAQLIVNLINNGLDILAFYYKLLLDQDEADEYFGTNGQYTELVLNRMSNIETFWGAKQNSDIPSVTLMGAHGQDLQENNNLLDLCIVLESAGFLQLSWPSNCNSWTNDMNNGIRQLPGGYGSPFLTSNAFVQFEEAVDPALQPSLETMPNAMVVGDGMLQFFEESTVDRDLGLDMIMGHEYCHVLQVREAALFDPYDVLANASPATKERYELMCDAVSAYYLAHPEGDNASIEETDQISLHAKSIGDPMVSDSTGENFHGTPGQRECASLWGAALAQTEEGVDMSFSSLVDAFNGVYAEIQNGDPSVCPDLTTDINCNNSSAEVGCRSMYVAFSVIGIAAVVIADLVF